MGLNQITNPDDHLALDSPWGKLASHLRTTCGVEHDNSYATAHPLMPVNFGVMTLISSLVISSVEPPTTIRTRSSASVIRTLP